MPINSGEYCVISGQQTRTARKLTTRTVILVLLGTVLALAPSAWFAWQYRAMPHQGSYHDDAVYWISAQALAEGRGYQISHLPEQPAQTKYPPLYPALLSLIWRISGSFPQNQALLMALQWSFAPLYLALAWLYFRRCAFGDMAGYALTLLIAIGPMTSVFAVSSLTEQPFSVMLLATVLLVENREHVSIRRGLLAGVLAAIAFLIRTNAIVLVISVPAVLLYRHRHRAALAFAAPLLAAIVGWQLWCSANAFQAKDDVMSYYAAYVGFYVRTFSWTDFPTRVWVNCAAVIESLARLVLFNSGQELWIRPLAWLMTVTAISGVVTLYRRGIQHYPVFAVLFIGVLLVWQYPPDTRFVYPLLPLYVAGLATKLAEVGGLGVRTWKSGTLGNRFAAAFVLLLIAFAAAGSVFSMMRGNIVMLPDYFSDRQTQSAEMLPVYRWISANTPADSRFAAYDDTLLYLHAKRRGYTSAILPALVYGQDQAAVSAYVTTLPSIWREKRVTHLLVTAYDFRRDLHEPALTSLRLLARDRSQFEQVYADQIAQVYRVVLPSR